MVRIVGFIRMAFVCIETQVDPLFGFAFLQTFIDILQEYFGTLSAATLKDHFDVVYQVRFQIDMLYYPFIHVS